MISFNDLIGIIGDSFFGGSTEIAGVMVLIFFIAGIMAFSKKLQTTLVLSVPLIMVFSFMSLIPAEIGLVMLVVVSLAIALEARSAFS